MVQRNTVGTVLNSTGRNVHMRYNQWNTSFRVMAHPEFFVTPRFSVDYKFGLEFTHYGDTYKVNANRSGTQSNNDSYGDFGLYRADPLLRNEHSLLLSLGFTFYILELPFL
jgi:hypothetical protein